MKIVSMESSHIDYPGVDSIVLGLAGCNFRCPYCHNPELITGENLKAIPIDEVEQYLLKKKKWVEGIVITGGEPTIHSDLPDLVDKLKQLGFLVKLDTNGTNPDMLEKLLDKLDFVAMDVKAPYVVYDVVARANADPQVIRKSVNLIKESGKKYEFRTTCVPGLVSESMVKSIAYWLEGSERYVLQNFKPGTCLDERYNDVNQFTEPEMDAMKEMAKPYFGEVEVRYNLGGVPIPN
jgi:pyruvate formate lyase activating enzyme